MRLVMASFNFIGGRHHVLQHAVHAEAHAVFLFVRLHVDVARAALHGVGENQIAELDDRSFFGRPFQTGQVHFGLFAGKFERFVLAGKVFHDLVEFLDAFRCAVELVDRFADGRLGSDHRLDVEAGHELDIVHREDVGWIGHRDRERGPDAGERHDLVADGRFLRDELDYRRIDFVKLQIDGWNAVLPGENRGNVVVADEPQLHQTGAQAATVLFLVLKRLLELIRRDQTVLDQDFAKPRRHRYSRAGGHSTRTALKRQRSTCGRTNKLARCDSRSESANTISTQRNLPFRTGNFSASVLSDRPQSPSDDISSHLAG